MVSGIEMKGTEALPATRSQPLKAATASVDDIRALADTVTNALEDDKAEDIIVIDLEGKSSLADIMVIASGRSARHVASIADHLAQTVKDATGRSVRLEGMPNADWVLLDMGDIIVHLFRPEVRAFYNLEKIWSDDSAHGHA
ncbi:ribosome silencing factor [Henriciella sp.]|uniref:ribosome silencing factor n=2 Tax=Henriciella sp. TaxID=1968823 RepID=UPI002630D53F|nr:ribosome silencing factor [Henriciella sp.]